MEIAYTIGKCHPYRPNYVGSVFARDCCVDLAGMRLVLIPTYKRILPRERTKLDWKTFEGRDAVWPGLRGGTWKTAFSKEDNTLYLEDGSFIEFKSYEQGRETMQGPPRHIIREDEEPKSVGIHNENKARQITTGSNLLITMTPIKYSGWIYSEVFQAAATSKDIDAFQMKSAENPFALQEVLDQMERDISDPVERAARLDGEFTYAQGRVWKEYGDHNLIDHQLLPKEWKRTITIDPHPDKPTAVNWDAEDDYGNLYFYREADYKGDVEAICNQIRVDTAGEYVSQMLIDPSSRASAAIRGQGRLVDEFRKYFPQIIEANNSREIGWDLVSKMCKDTPSGPKLFVLRSCPLTDFQMRNYSWKPPTATGETRTRPEVVKKNDDHPDNVRYRAMAQMAGGKHNFEGFGIDVYAN